MQLMRAPFIASKWEGQFRPFKSSSNDIAGSRDGPRVPPECCHVAGKHCFSHSSVNATGPRSMVVNGAGQRECRAPRNQDYKNKESSRSSVHVETSTSTALVSCDGLGGYDWSD
ncbi:hypothetical protein Tco_0581946 [Tanacetum coccineum]